MKNISKMSECKRYKEFCLYFDELDKLGINWGLFDLRMKAKELDLKVPAYKGVVI